MEYWEWQGMDSSAVMWLIGFGIIVLLLFLIFFFRSGIKKQVNPTALKNLKARLARGEIDKKEYQKEKRALENQTS